MGHLLVLVIALLGLFLLWKLMNLRNLLILSALWTLRAGEYGM